MHKLYCSRGRSTREPFLGRGKYYELLTSNRQLRIAVLKSRDTVQDLRAEVETTPDPSKRQATKTMMQPPSVFHILCRVCCSLTFLQQHVIAGLSLSDEDETGKNKQ